MIILSSSLTLLFALGVDLVAIGELSLADAKSRLSGSEYSKASDKLRRAHELFLDRSAEALHKQMVDNNEMVSVHWFYGESETGKSFLAERLASEMGVPFYKTTTTTDPFQFYQAESTIILDELRPEVIPFSELLAILNPFSRGSVAVSSRYNNKALSCKTRLLTQAVAIPDTKIKKYDQLIHLVVVCFKKVSLIFPCFLVSIFQSENRPSD